MALQVWLPLTKDLRNQGLNNMTFSNTNTTNIVEDSAGKLGKCYRRTTKQTSGRIISNTTINLSADFSMCCWAKVTDCVGDTANGLVSNHSHSDNTGFGITIKQVSTSDYRISCNTGTGSGRTYNTYYGTSNIKDAWHHLTITYNKSATQLKLWVDGICEKTVTYTSGSKADYIVLFDWSTTYDSTTYRPAVAMNDVRIYDHCLSEMEVKQLSQGLVLHYPLNRGGWGQENLAKNSNLGWNSTAYNIIQGTMAENCTVGETYTITIKGTPSSGCKFGIWADGGNKLLCYFYDHVGDIWTATATLSSTNNATKFSVWDVPSTNPTHNAHIDWIKIEKGTIATPWCPNSSDVLATTMGLNGTTEYDTSGYCNNLTKNGTYSYTSDTPKYAVSTIFNGTEWMNGTTPGAEIKTLACWAKTSKNKSTSQFMVADSTSNMCISFYSGCIIGVFGSTRSTGSRCTLGTSYKENDWNHFVVVKTGDAGERTIYCNGEPLTPTTNDYWSVATGFFIGSRNNSGTLPFHGQICDVRAYATALSASDVKSLYQNCATIDPDGTIRGQIRS